MGVLLPTVITAGLLLAVPALLREPFGRLRIAPWFTVSTFALSPSTLSFSATTPNSTASSTATATWNLSLALLSTSTWTLTVSGTAPSCTTAPLSSVAVRCTSITDTGFSLGTGTHTCSTQFNLSSTAQTVALGADIAAVSLSGHRTVTVQFTFSDTFKYTETSTPCNISIAYVLTAS
jgi:hypothetical protein